VNKAWKLEKKKAQYENRIRALETQIWKLQELTKQQHNYILYLKDLYESKGKVLAEGPENGHLLVVDGSNS